MHTDLILRSSQHPERTAIEHAGRACSYGELADAARRLASVLRSLAIEAGASVCIMAPNSIEWLQAFYAASIHRSPVVPLSTMLTPRELRWALSLSRAQALFVGPEQLAVATEVCAALAAPPRIIVIGDAAPGGLPTLAGLVAGAELAELEGEQPGPTTHALTLFTSGTTGQAKGAMLSLENLRAQVDMACSAFAPRAGERVLSALPLFHSFGLNAVAQVVMRYGGTLVMHTRFDVERIMCALALDDITWFAGVPTMYAYLLEAHAAGAQGLRGNLRYCVSGGAPLRDELSEQFTRAFGAPIFNGYGLTETVVGACMNRPGTGGSRPGSVGRPFDGMSVRVLGEDGRELPSGQPGEIAVSGPTVMLGYLDDPLATQQAISAGWFMTGDLGYVDADGFCFIVDRKKDLIIKGGFNIYPREVEDVLCELPEVAEAAVIGVPEPLKGELVCAVIALRPGASLTPSSIQAHLMPRLAKNKHPTRYHFVERLPRGATGKLLKLQVRSELPALASSI